MGDPEMDAEAALRRLEDVSQAATAPELLKRLQAAGVRVWWTDDCGDVEVVKDGERLSVGAERPCWR